MDLSKFVVSVSACFLLPPLSPPHLVPECVCVRRTGLRYCTLDIVKNGGGGVEWGWRIQKNKKIPRNTMMPSHLV